MQHFIIVYADTVTREKLVVYIINEAFALFFL